MPQGKPKKPRKPRTKSRDSPPTQPGQPKRQTKRRTKKSLSEEDPQLQLQQQKLQQQIVQQIEQQHRLIQLRQAVTAGPSHMGPEGPENVVPPRPQPVMPPADVPDVSAAESPMPRQPTPQGASGPRPMRPLSTGHPQASQQDSFAERFPTPEAYLQYTQQQQHVQIKPVVQYVADANNPFSDSFQQLQRQEQVMGAAPVPTTTPAADARVKTIGETTSPAGSNALPSPSQGSFPEQQNAGLKYPAGHWSVKRGPSADGVPQARPRSGSAAQREDAERGQAPAAAPLQDPRDRNRETPKTPGLDINRATPVEVALARESPRPTAAARNEDEEKDASEQNAAVNKPAAGPAGLGALQKLESMVADIAHEEEACKELEKCPESETREFDFNEMSNFDLYEPETIEGFEEEMLNQVKPSTPAAPVPREEAAGSPLERLTRDLDKTSRMQLLEENLPENRLLAACESRKTAAAQMAKAKAVTEQSVNRDERQAAAGNEKENTQPSKVRPPIFSERSISPVEEVSELEPSKRAQLAAAEQLVVPYQPRGQNELCPPRPQAHVVGGAGGQQAFPHGRQLPEASMSIPMKDVSDTAAHVQQPHPSPPLPSNKPNNQKARNPKPKRPKAPNRIRDELTKREHQELKRQEYERKKREYEEQQMKKRMLQRQLRIQKQMLKDEKRRQKNALTTPRTKSKSKAKLAKEAAPAAPTLALCEPKLLLTHALIHPCGSAPFNGHCPLQGSFGKAKLDGALDYYKQFPAADVNDVLGHPPTPPSSLPPSPGSVNVVSGVKPLMNGDVSKAELLRLPQVEETPFKRARYLDNQESEFETAVSRASINALTSMPTPPLADNAAPGTDADARRDARPAFTRSSSANSTVSLSENVQYVGSSSPESDALDGAAPPKFPALRSSAERDRTESPTFPPAVTSVKREQDETPSSCCAATRTGTESSAAPAHVTDDLDSIDVTLTLSPNSEQRVTDTVASVADLIGCSPPWPSDIVIEPCKPGMKKAAGEGATPTAASKAPYPYSEFSLNSTERKKPEGPYCKHCDVLVIGIGIARGADEAAENDDDGANTSKDSKPSDADGGYKIHSVNVAAADWLGDIFCSENCLKQYHAHLDSETLPTVDDSKSSLVGSMSADPSGRTSAGNSTSLDGTDLRGGVMANGLSPTALSRRKHAWKVEDALSEVSAHEQLADARFCRRGRFVGLTAVLG